MPAWAEQRSAYVDGKHCRAMENYLRRRTPEAGFREYSRNYEPDVRTSRAQKW